MENVSLSDTQRMLLFSPLRSLGLISNAYCYTLFHRSYISELRVELYRHLFHDGFWQRIVQTGKQLTIPSWKNYQHIPSIYLHHLLFSPTILVKNLETLVSISPSPMLIWVSQWSQCFKIRVAQHWGGRRHISGGKTLWSRNCMIFPENSRETVSVSTICDEYCSSMNGIVRPVCEITFS